MYHTYFFDTMESQNLIKRDVYPVVPPKVEYSLTQTGKSLMPVPVAIRDRGAEYLRGKHQEPCCFMMDGDPFSRSNHNELGKDIRYEKNQSFYGLNRG